MLTRRPRGRPSSSTATASTRAGSTVAEARGARDRAAAAGGSGSGMPADVIAVLGALGLAGFGGALVSRRRLGRRRRAYTPIGEKARYVVSLGGGAAAARRGGIPAVETSVLNV